MNSGYIYVVSKNGCSKIGVTCDPFVRLYNLRYSNGKECEAKALWKCRYSAIYKIEDFIKTKFYSDAFNGREWFTINADELISSVIDAAKTLNVEISKIDWPNEPMPSPISVDEYYINKVKIRDWLLSTPIPILRIASKTGISRGSIYRFKSGKLAPRANTVKLLLDFMEHEQGK